MAESICGNCGMYVDDDAMEDHRVSILCRALASPASGAFKDNWLPNQIGQVDAFAPANKTYQDSEESDDSSYNS